MSIATAETTHHHVHNENCTHEHSDKIVTISDNEDSSSSNAMTSRTTTGDADSPISRGEKKARKALSKLGLVPVAGINRVTFKRARNMVFAINNPDVYASPNHDSWIVYGEAKSDDFAAHAAAAAKKAASPAPAAPVVSTKEEVEEEAADVDETGLDPSDIEMIMSQANVSRQKAAKALRENDKDIVNAIMALTM